MDIEARRVRRRSIDPRRLRRRRAANRAASRRASGATVRRSSTSSSERARRKSTCSAIRGTAEAATLFRPRCSAVRRRTSASVSRRNGDPFLSGASGDLNVEIRRMLAVVTTPEQPSQELGQQGVRGNVTQRLIRRVGLPRPGAVAAELGGDGGGMCLRELAGLGRSVGQQVGGQFPDSVDVDLTVGVPRQFRVEPRCAGLAKDPGEPQVEQGVVGAAVGGAAQQGGGKALPHRLAVEQVEHRQHPPRVHRLRWADVDPPGTQRRHEVDEVAGDAMRGVHQRARISSAAIRRRRAAGRSDA